MEHHTRWYGMDGGQATKRTQDTIYNETLYKAWVDGMGTVAMELWQGTIRFRQHSSDHLVR
jgi:aryl-phospho-beta-D-glucosidase BglC (GH1 family)